MPTRIARNTRDDSKFNLPQPLVRGALIACLLLGSVAPWVVAQAPDANPCDDPWTVCLFKYSDYLGEKLVYTVAPGMRQLAVQVLPQGFEDQVSSIKVGANVAIYVFKGRYYGGWPSSFRGSVQNLNSGYASISSMVVFPRTFGSPLGAWGWNAYWDMSLAQDGVDATDHHHFFPVPDMQQAPAAGYPELGVSDLDKNMNVVATAHEQVSVVLYDGRHYQGAALELPSKDSSWAVIDAQKHQGLIDNMQFWETNLGRYSWSDRAASMTVSWNGPSLGRPIAQSFQVFIGTDFPGKDYRTFACPDGPAECERVCLSESQCKSFTWTNDSKQCFLKTEVPQQVADQRCISGSRIGANAIHIDAPPWKKITVEYSVNRPGGDYTKIAAQGYEECKHACEIDSRCNAFTWVKPGIQAPTGVCWLKDVVTPGVTDTNMVSGFVPGAPGATVKGGKLSSVFKMASQAAVFTVEEQVNRPGGDYAGFPVDGGHEKCQEACAKDPKCKCYTWAKPGVAGNTGFCWLKDSVPAAQKHPDAVSGVLQTGPPAQP